MKNLLYLLLLPGILFFSCSKENVDPNDFRSDEAIKDNTLVLRENTYCMAMDQQGEIVSSMPDKIVYQNTSLFANNLEVGNIIVNPFGNQNSFIGRVTSIANTANEIEVAIEMVQMSEAFSAWVIDSRSDKLTVKPRSYWEWDFDFSQEYIPGVDFSFSGTVSPNFSIQTEHGDYELLFRWDENDPNYTNGPYMRLRIQNYYVQLTGNILIEAEGSFGSEASPEDPILIGPIPYVEFLSLYFKPFMEIKGKLKGTFTSPGITHRLGPFNLECGYNNATANVFGILAPFPTLSSTIEPPSIENLSGEFKPTAGVDFIIAPSTMYETGLDEIAEVNLTLKTYEYLNFEFIHKGSFRDRQPRIAFEGTQGNGFNVSFNLSAFAETLSKSLSTDDYEYPSKRWNLYNFNTCDAFPSADISYSQGFVDLSIGSGGQHGLGYNIYVNDELFSEEVFAYDQTYTINLPPTEDLVNKISIADVDNLGCYLEDIYVDPTLVGNCEDHITDARDGNRYCYATIGSYTWLTENLRYTGGGSIGKWYNNEETDENLVYGRLYTHAQIGNICPQGWHIPTLQQWNDLIDALGGLDSFGKNAKAASTALWPAAELPEESTFGAAPAGEYYSWISSSSGRSQFGNRGKVARFWSSTILDDAPVMIDIGNGEEAVVNIGNSANLVGHSQFKSIREIGFSCRCVQD